jgi:hypothetical protein
MMQEKKHRAKQTIGELGRLGGQRVGKTREKGENLEAGEENQPRATSR